MIININVNKNVKPHCILDLVTLSLYSIYSVGCQDLLNSTEINRNLPDTLKMHHLWVQNTHFTAFHSDTQVP